MAVTACADQRESGRCRKRCEKSLKAEREESWYQGLNFTFLKNKSLKLMCTQLFS